MLSITGRTHDDWKADDANFEIPAIGKSGTFTEQCQSLVMRELSPQQIEVKRANWKPWGVVAVGRLLGAPRAAGLPRHPQPLCRV